MRPAQPRPKNHLRPFASICGRNGFAPFFTEMHAHYFKMASIAACEIASSTSDAAPLQAILPITFPSTLIGRPPWFGNPSGKAREKGLSAGDHPSAAFS